MDDLDVKKSGELARTVDELERMQAEEIVRWAVEALR
jgi:hypothetical protein